MDLHNVVQLQNLRQRQNNFQQTFQRKMQITKSLVQRLSLEFELEGHTGCVNCLEWNTAGDLLASGSDDLNVILWTPFLKKISHTIPSGHQGNIFSVKFVPGSNDHCIVTGAADFKIRVTDYIKSKVVFSCGCHGGRVKRLAAASNVPYMFWSAAEDGMIMQYDLRAPHQCSNECSNVLINLVNHLGRNAEAKCIAVNPLNPDLLAVGANDPFIRVYDRRMIKPTTVKFSAERSASPWDLSFASVVEQGEDNLSCGCVTYFVAGHLPKKQSDYKRRHRSLTATYVTFSPDGKDLLANLGGEQIYLFDIMSKRKQLVFNMSEKALNLNFDPESKEELKIDCCDAYCKSKNGTNGLAANGITHSESCLHNTKASTSLLTDQKPPNASIEVLPTEVEKIKAGANQAFERHDYTLAISLYSSGIVMCPKAACLYGNRAAAYIKRGWDGDFYAAIRDCHTALDLDPSYLKAHFRLAQCLQKLRRHKDAYDCLQAFKIKFPQYAKTKSFETFENDVKMGIFTEMSEVDCANEEEDESNPFNFTNGVFRPTISDLPSRISEKEKAWRSSAFDYEYRYCGHCNTTTDIKEANFLGSYGEFIIAGSDDGSIFIWDRVTTNTVRVLRGDDSIVNCLQPHPSTCMLATSGIDPVVRFWSPRAEDGTRDEREVVDKDDVAFANQRRMNADPLELMLINMGYHLPGVLDQLSEDESNSGSDRNVIQCRTS